MLVPVGNGRFFAREGWGMGLKAKEIMAFVPAGANYELALSFYRDLGFEVSWKSNELAIVEKDACRFFLQNFANEEMQKNFMMDLAVEDLDRWWAHICKQDLVSRYPGVKATAPEVYPWGKREIHLLDPAGVLWHISTLAP